MTSSARNFRSRATAQQLRRRVAFTLLELLLAMVLAGALMAGLWGILSLNLRTFEAGRVKTQRAQLTRALAERIEDDLRNLAPLAEETRATHDRLNAAGATASSFDAMPSAAAAPISNPSAVVASPSQPGLGPAAGVAPPVIPPPPANAAESPSAVDAATPPAYVPARIDSLVGSSHALQLRVSNCAAAADAPPATDASGQLVNPLPRDLLVVEYRLEQPQSAPQPVEGIAARSGPAWRGAGLTRRQRAWSIEATSPDAFAADDTASFLTSDTGSAAADNAFTTGADGVLPINPSPVGDYDSLDPTNRPGSTQASLPTAPGNPSQQLFVPEVTGWQLRYFDGAQWHAQWHSARKGLPVAIEVTLSLRAEEPSTRRRPRTADSSSTLATAAIDDLADTGQRDETLRLVVCLPAALGPVSARGSREAASASLNGPMPGAAGAMTSPAHDSPTPRGLP
ncbi:MAG: type II secretion system protein GspJ [Pirellulales bacterium]|nr:type II secretion system protein GspJ [Pirellulales bacterium]